MADNETREETVEETRVETVEREVREPADPPPADDEARKLRSELTRLRKQSKDYEARLKQQEDAELSQSQRLERELDEHRNRTSTLADENRTMRVQLTAQRLGVRGDALEDLPKLIDWEGVEADDPRSVEKAVRTTLERKPWLRETGSAGVDAGAGRQNGARTSNLNDLIRTAAGRTP